MMAYSYSYDSYGTGTANYSFYDECATSGHSQDYYIHCSAVSDLPEIVIIDVFFDWAGSPQLHNLEKWAIEELRRVFAWKLNRF